MILQVMDKIMLTVFIDQCHQPFVYTQALQVLVCNLNLCIDQRIAKAIDMVFFCHSAGLRALRCG